MPYFTYCTVQLCIFILPSYIQLDNGEVIREPNQLCNVFNDYFVNIAKDIGINDPIKSDDTIESIISQYMHHSSIETIKENYNGISGFNFKCVTSDYILCLLNKLNARKATGFDNIPPKLLRLGSDIPLTVLINSSITTSSFPVMLKRAEVTPIYKKNDVMDKQNYRPVSVLPTISKIFENVLISQLNKHFDSIFSPHMSGFRKNFSCEHVLTNFIESAKRALDDQTYVGSVMTDLSRAFDCLPPKLLLSKCPCLWSGRGVLQITEQLFCEQDTTC